MTNVNLPQNRRNLYNTGITLLVLMLIDVVDFTFGILDANRLNLIMQEGIGRTVMIIYIAVSLLIILANTFLGARAISEAQNPTSSSLHIKLAKLAFIINLLMLIALVADLLSPTSSKDIFSTVKVALNVLIMYFYNAEASKVRRAK